jgi:hypothetical protein
LLGKIDTVQGTRSSDTHLMRGARQWLSSLDAASESRFVKLAFELNEPDPADFAAAPAPRRARRLDCAPPARAPGWSAAAPHHAGV